MVLSKTDVKLWKGHQSSLALHPPFIFTWEETKSQGTETAAEGACGVSLAGAWLLDHQAKALYGFRGFVIY